MKKNFSFLIVLLLLGCSNPVDNLEIGAPFSQGEAIVDEWALTGVRHVDNLDLSLPFTDVTGIFTASEATLSITENSFNYSQSSGPVYLETSGTWAFDDANFPEFWVLNSNTQIKLGKPVRALNDSLVLILERKCEDRTVSSYEYYFERK